MGIIGIVLLIVFVIICILLVGIILLQKDEGGGLGGLFGGGGGAAFGSRSQTVITKTTYVFVTLFFLTTFGLALLNRAPVVESLTDTANQVESIESSEGQDWLNNDESSANTTESATMSATEVEQGEN